jgi:hypothetical protein
MNLQQFLTFNRLLLSPFFILTRSPAMSASWRVDATIVGGPAKCCAELLDYFRPPRSIPDTMATRSEPPRKRQRRGDQASIVCDHVDESAAILLASQDLVLVSQNQDDWSRVYSC